VCWKPCSSCWSSHLHREEFLSAPIHSPPLWFAVSVHQQPELNLVYPDWRFPIIEWLVEGKLPSNQTEARRIARRAKAFVLIDGELYKHAAAGILMRCILWDQGRELFARDTYRHLRSPHQSENTCREGFPPRFLLANSSRIIQGHHMAV
jgi:hypothetical protein